MLRVQEKIRDILLVKKQLFGITIVDDFDHQAAYRGFSQYQRQKLKGLMEYLLTLDLKSMSDSEFLETMDMYGCDQNERQFVVQMIYSEMIEQK